MSEHPSPPTPPTVDAQLFAAAEHGDTDSLATLLDAHPSKLHVRAEPYAWTLLHAAAQHGRLAAVDLLLRRGLDPNVREDGDRTCAMHWAAAAGQLDVVRRLVDAGGDVVGTGDDHELEVIGWATCWDGCDDEAHRAIVDLLLSRGARHHIFSAIAMNLGDEVRRIVADDPTALARRMSRNENHQLPLHFAVRKKRPDMVQLLVELGADPLGQDDSGLTAAAYATSREIDRPVMEAIRARGIQDLLAAGTLRNWDAAERIVEQHPDSIAPASGVLHLAAKRGDARTVRWLLAHGADPSARWAHWDAVVTPLHLAAMQGHAEVAQLLLAAGADTSIHDTKHDGDPLDWAQFFGQLEVVRLLERWAPGAG